MVQFLEKKVLRPEYACGAFTKRRSTTYVLTMVMCSLA